MADEYVRGGRRADRSAHYDRDEVSADEETGGAYRRWGRGASNYGIAGNYDGGNYGDYRGGASRSYGERSERRRARNNPFAADARGPEFEWGAGYGGGYGRSGDYGERGGGGRWSRGQQSGLPAEGEGEPAIEDWALSGGGRRMAAPNFAGRGPKNYRRSDERILEDVCEALTADPELDASEVEVRVHHGIVTLSGAVDSRAAKRLAEGISELVSGVADVENQLQVQSRFGSGKAAAEREIPRRAHRERDSAKRPRKSRTAAKASRSPRAEGRR